LWLARNALVVDAIAGLGLWTILVVDAFHPGSCPPSTNLVHAVSGGYVEGT
jgi:hypothetical protein